MRTRGWKKRARDGRVRFDCRTCVHAVRELASRRTRRIATIASIVDTQTKFKRAQRRSKTPPRAME
jgi:hypothetical protein